MPNPTITHTCRDGRVLSWQGLNVCVCSQCDEIFNSPTAFDFHLKRKGQAGVARHDHSKMPRNDKGYKVTKLYEDGHHTEH